MLLAVIYLALLVGQLVMLIRTIRRPVVKRWGLLLASELFCALGAWRLARFFDALPGVGMMPGLTYLAEVLFSLGAAVVYGALLAVSAIIAFAMWVRRR